MAKETTPKTSSTPVSIPVSIAFLQEAVMYGGRTEKIVNATKMPGVKLAYIPEWNLISFNKEKFKTHYMPMTNVKHIELE